MKIKNSKLVLAALFSISISSPVLAGECALSDPNFCGCFVNNFSQNCAKHLPARTCRHLLSDKNLIKNKIRQTTVEKSCLIQRESAYETCIAASNKFLKDC